MKSPLLRDAGDRQQHGKEIGGIFDFHLGILRDKSLTSSRSSNEINSQRTIGRVRGERGDSHKYAATRLRRCRTGTFPSGSKTCLRHRAPHPEKPDRTETPGSGAPDRSDVVVIAHDLLPSADRGTGPGKHVKRVRHLTWAGAPATRRSWPGRWASPPWWGMGNLTNEVGGGDTGHHRRRARGMVIVNPDPDQLAEYREDARKSVIVR